LIDETTLQRAKGAGLDPALHLAANDSTAFFKALGDLVSPGPTLTNANDLRAIMVEP
jgi:glycerate 2-kinase